MYAEIEPQNYTKAEYRNKDYPVYILNIAEKDIKVGFSSFRDKLIYPDGSVRDDAAKQLLNDIDIFIEDDFEELPLQQVTELIKTILNL